MTGHEMQKIEERYWPSGQVPVPTTPSQAWAALMVAPAGDDHALALAMFRAVIEAWPR